MHSVWQAYIRDANGDILPGASVTVRVQATNAIATIYADKSGTSPLANPFVADASGMARFYALPNTYKITATSGGFTGELVNVELALAREGLTDADAQFDFVPEAPVDGVAYARKDGAWVAGATNLGYTASPTDGTVTSDTGTDATIPAGSTVDASLMLPADKSKLDGIEAGAQVNAVTSVNGQTGSVVLDAGDIGAQPVDATLTAMAGVATAADRIIYFTGVDVAAQTTLTAFGRSLIDDADAAAARTTLELGTAATATVTTSNADTTAGRLTKVGDYGLLGVGRALTGGDYNTLVASGRYMINNSASNRPANIATLVDVIGGIAGGGSTNDRIVQTAYGLHGNGAFPKRSWFRESVEAGATWGPWVENYTTSNVDGVAWTVPTLQNGWTLHAAYPVRYRVVMGMLWIFGIITAGTKTDSTTVMTLPAGARPISDRVLNIGSLEASASTAAHVRVSTAGEVRIFSINESHNNVVINAVVRLV